MIVLTYKATSGACVSGDVAGWIIAIKNGDNIPYLLHTFHIPSHLQCRLAGCNSLVTCIDVLWIVVCVYREDWFDFHAKAHPVNGWELVGVSKDLHQVCVWRGPQEYPDTTLSVRATQGDYVTALPYYHGEQ